MSTASKLGLRREFFKQNGVSDEMYELVKRRVQARIGLGRFEHVMGFSSPCIRAWELGKKPPSRFQYQCYKDTLERFGA